MRNTAASDEEARLIFLLSEILLVLAFRHPRSQCFSVLFRRPTLNQIAFCMCAVPAEKPNFGKVLKIAHAKHCCVRWGGSPHPACGTKEPVRFDSFRFRTFLRKLFGSVRFGADKYFSRFDTVRTAFFGRVVARSGSVRFVSASGSGRFRNWPIRFGSVRPVRFLIPSWKHTNQYKKSLKGKMCREFTKGGLVKGGSAIRHVFNFSYLSLSMYVYIYIYICKSIYY